MCATPGLGPHICSPAPRRCIRNAGACGQTPPPTLAFPRPRHRPQGPCAWTLSPWVGAPAQRGASSLSPHLVWVGALWGFRTVAWGPTTSLTPGLQATGTFVQHSTAHSLPPGRGAATHLVPGVSPWPGRSSGRLQDKGKGQPELASGVTPEVVRVPHSPGIRRSSTAGRRTEDTLENGAPWRALDTHLAGDALDSWGGRARREGEGRGERGRGSYHLFHIVFLKSETEKRN